MGTHFLYYGSIILISVDYKIMQEERRTLRQQLVEIFGCICGLEKELLSQLLCSVLPTELAIDIMNRKNGN